MLNGKKTIQVKRKHREKQNTLESTIQVKVKQWRVYYKLKANTGECNTR
jgi:hypothetical protein